MRLPEGSHDLLRELVGAEATRLRMMLRLTLHGAYGEHVAHRLALAEAILSALEEESA